MDKICLKNMQFYGYHGVFPEENKLGQRFYVDVELHTSLKKAGETDDLSESIDYGQVYQHVKKIVEGEAKRLIESVAEMIASDLLASFTQLQACTIRVMKPNPPIHGHYEAVVVEIYREREK